MELIFDGDLCLNKEDSSFEAKSAIGGIPLSMWESYSSFANSFGGTIVLGLEETEDGALVVKGVKNTDKVMNEIWNTLNNPQKVSCNILMADDIGIVEHNGKRLISVRVRRADRHDRPIYINDNPLGGTFRRNGPNDYRCTRPEVAEMMRDNVDTPLDAAALDGFDMDDIDRGTLAGYRMLMKLTDENHMWNRVQDDEFLKLIGAVKKGDDGRPHPTLAGLLMFGMEHRITCEVPNYKLDYIEYMDSGVKWEYRIVSGDGRWSGNVFDFYSNVTNRLHVSIGRPFVIGNDWRRVENTDTDKAIREALINALIHADHRGRMGVRVELRPDSFIVRNPGLFRISVKEAEEGGRSDPRNHTLAKMFSLIGAVERVGSGLYRIIETWKKNGFEPPTIQESLNPPTVKLILSMKVDSRTSAIPNEEKVLRLIAEDGSISIEKIARKTVMSKSKTDTIIKKLREDGRIERTGGKKGGYWLIR
jgi:predicted HTH transcriptional regulator